jgi:Rieske 2Fe-2S family protein
MDLKGKTIMTIDLSSELATKLKKARAGLYQARHLPGEIYTSPEIFRHEIDTIFMKEWQCVGREEEYPNPGDYLAFRIAGEPALLARDNEGKLRAFRNVCLHRGVEVATGRGNSKSFSCPYHAWTYDLTGRLMGAPMSQEVSGFDPRSCRLPAMKVDSWGGYIFVNFDPDAKDLADCLDEDGVRDFTAFLHPELTRANLSLKCRATGNSCRKT